jgi:hypothetical protein
MESVVGGAMVLGDVPVGRVRASGRDGRGPRRRRHHDSHAAKSPGAVAIGERSASGTVKIIPPFAWDHTREDRLSIDEAAITVWSPQRRSRRLWAVREQGRSIQHAAGTANEETPRRTSVEHVTARGMFFTFSTSSAVAARQSRVEHRPAALASRLICQSWDRGSVPVGRCGSDTTHRREAWVPRRCGESACHTRGNASASVFRYRRSKSSARSICSAAKSSASE